MDPRRAAKVGAREVDLVERGEDLSGVQVARSAGDHGVHQALGVPAEPVRVVLRLHVPGDDRHAQRGFQLLYRALEQQRLPRSRGGHQVEGRHPVLRQPAAHLRQLHQKRVRQHGGAFLALAAPGRVLPDAREAQAAAHLLVDDASDPIERCADVDLGRWMKGSYRIPGPPADPGEEAGEAAGEGGEDGTN